MPRTPRQIPESLLAAVRDGDVTKAQAARDVGIDYKWFEVRFAAFRAQQMRQRSSRALANCTAYISQCQMYGWRTTDLRALRELWWRWHDEEGNLLARPRIGAWR